MSKYYSYIFYADRNVRPCTILGYSHNIPQKSQENKCITRVIETSGTIAKVITKQKTTKTTSTELRAVAPCKQTHPQQPGKTRICLSMLTNRQVPLLNLTETNITSHADLQDAFNSLCVCSHGGREGTEDQSTE